ncbi:Crp/Fnr family transcriptional regulator [Mariprofundus ferrooxydans]|uniref:Crp/Fnr family transcriptional regulator n=1 Tax=Mariprofundus ferrooxydans TaxID=314344 RepID=UPI00037FDB10|nr:Crp/Fnr family transcriptional regulator [Mariprofundus ferrooxydans]
MHVTDSLLDAYEATLEASPVYMRFRGMPVCESMGGRESMMLFSCLDVVSVAAGETIYEAGEVSDQTMRLVIEGRVSVISPSLDTYTELGAGDTFGLFSFLDEDRPHSASLKAISNVTLLTLNRDYFNVITLEDPVMGNHLLRFMFRLLSRMSLKLETEYAAIHNYVTARRV